MDVSISILHITLTELNVCRTVERMKSNTIFIDLQILQIQQKRDLQIIRWLKIWICKNGFSETLLNLKWKKNTLPGATDYIPMIHINNQSVNDMSDAKKFL
jgi:hypothetical protein